MTTAVRLLVGVLLAVGLLLAAGALAASCLLGGGPCAGLRADTYDQAGAATPDPQVVAHVEEFARLALPVSAADLQVREEWGLDTVMHVRFALAAGDLEGFIDQAGFDQPLEGGWRAILSGEWADELAAAEHFLGSSEVVDVHFGRAIGVVLDDPARPVVYLVATTM